MGFELFTFHYIVEPTQCRLHYFSTVIKFSPLKPLEKKKNLQNPLNQIIYGI